MALDVSRFLARFVEEARDHLTRLGEGLVKLDAGPADPDTVNELFRAAHTVKGSARMLKLTPITELAHRLEDVLGALRDNSLAFGPGLGRVLQRGVDSIAAQVDRVAEGAPLADVDQALCAALAAAMTGGGDADSPPPAADGTSAVAAEPTPAGGVPPGSVAVVAATPEIRLKSAETVRVQLSKLDELIKLMGEVVSSHALLRQRLLDVQALIHDAARAPVSQRLERFGRDLRDDVFAQELLMEELHAKALVMRMLPLAIVFEPAARMVRDLGRTLGKDVECVTAGMEIELDRQMIDRLADPIVHLLRNAVDHGIETPEIRAAAGKPRHGRLSLSARQDGGFVVIEVADDGAGLPLAAIRDKAVRKGVLSADSALALAETDLIDLIFAPGFSTSAIVTDLSGRGVGMDVVKHCVVDDLQGEISVETRPGAGTTFALRLPLSLAVMRVLLVGACGETFGFTAQSVSRLMRVSEKAVLMVAGRRSVVIDNEFVPIADLAELLSLPPAKAKPTAPGSGGLLLVVVRVRSEKLAIRVDELHDERDMVIKPLPEHLRHLQLVSGMVMTGRNALVSVLHASALVDRARQARIGAPAAGDRGGAGDPGSAGGGARLLVVDDSLNTREIEKDVLEAHGFIVTLAEDGLDGLRKARAEQFDAVLTDVEMPHMDGFTLTATLRDDERYRAIPIIIITSREKEEDKRRGIQVGADAYIVKGEFDQGNLVETVKSLLG